ncbi:MAG: hypothetical protein QM710_12575 [Flavobacterium sp.]
MEQLLKYAWILLIAVTAFNVFQLKRRFKKHIEKAPEKEAGYNLIIRNYLIYGTIPWVIVAIGCLSGQTKTIFDYFEPAKLNPFVLLFHFSIVVIWILIIRFIYFKDGAGFLENYPGLIKINAPGHYDEKLSKNNIKIFTALALTGGIIAMILMWTNTIPHP